MVGFEDLVLLDIPGILNEVSALTMGTVESVQDPDGHWIARVTRGGVTEKEVLHPDRRISLITLYFELSGPKKVPPPKDPRWIRRREVNSSMVSRHAKVRSQDPDPEDLDPNEVESVYRKK